MKSNERIPTRELLTHDTIQKAVNFKLKHDLIDYSYTFLRLLAVFLGPAIILE